MIYDLAIVGGGLAGLSLAIQAARAGYQVIVFEKESYPHHKVCGEYISNESRNFLIDIGLKIGEMNLPQLSKLTISSPSGNMISHALDVGGFGISRYKIDHALAELARLNGAGLKEKTKVQDLSFTDDHFTINTNAGSFRSRIAVASFGKRSNLDVKWKRDFIDKKPNAQNNYLGIKYHIKYPQSPDTISLHNFENGYCGISAIEEEKYCLCYLTTSSNLKRYGNSIPEMEKNILQKNPHLEKIFLEAEFLWDSPVTISQISFDKKTAVEDHVLMTGDAAGMITPLCGNGMSMALQSSKLAFESILPFLENKISRNEMELRYKASWEEHFSKRLAFGRKMQSLFGRSWLTNLFIASVKPFPFLVKWLISKSHGREF